MRELRSHFDDEAEFVRWVDDVQRPEGYRVVAAFEDGSREAAAVAGFRVGHMLSRGRHLYVDDLSTLPTARRRGYGRALLNWLGEEARRQGCDRLHLDSGVEANRQDAHRLYFNTGLRISAYHFSRPVE
jgi:GNAT superfamily N-acetyltransferase